MYNLYYNYAPRDHGDHGDINDVKYNTQAIYIYMLYGLSNYRNFQLLYAFTSHYI